MLGNVFVYARFHVETDPLDPEINNFTLKNASKNSGLDAPKSRFEGILEASWDVLGA